jgi:hypothetical protein
MLILMVLLPVLIKAATNSVGAKTTGAHAKLDAQAGKGYSPSQGQ